MKKAKHQLTSVCVQCRFFRAVRDDLMGVYHVVLTDADYQSVGLYCMRHFKLCHFELDR